MLALYKTGWRCDALAAYRRVRQLLTRELGIEPSDELRELHEAAVSDRSAARADAPSQHGRWAGHATNSRATDSHARSEEHTSELQSRRDLVCRLLLEKKKKNIYHPYTKKKKHVKQDNK